MKKLNFLKNSFLALALSTTLYANAAIDYANILMSGVNNLKHVNSTIEVPYLPTIQNVYQLYKIYENGEELNYINITKIGLTSAKIAVNTLGVAVPGLNAVALMFWAYNSVPKFVNIGNKYIYNPLKTLESKYPMTEFTRTSEGVSLSNTSYLTCSLYKNEEDMKESKNAILTDWAMEDDLPIDKLSKDAEYTYYNKYIIINGRWVEASTNKEDGTSQWGFITMDPPSKVNAACLNVLSRHTLPKNVNLKYLVATAGNTNISNQFPIYYYVPALIDKENILIRLN